MNYATLSDPNLGEPIRITGSMFAFQRLAASAGRWVYLSGFGIEEVGAGDGGALLLSQPEIHVFFTEPADDEEWSPAYADVVITEFDMEFLSHRETTDAEEVAS